MSPDDVPAEWVETGGEILHSRFYWSSTITFAEYKAAVAEVLAAVLPEAMAEALEEERDQYKAGAQELGAYLINPYREGSPGEG